MKYLTFMLTVIILTACGKKRQQLIKHKRWVGDVYVDQKTNKLVILVADKQGSGNKARSYTIDIATVINQETKDSVDLSQLTFPCDKGNYVYYEDTTEMEEDKATK